LLPPPLPLTLTLRSFQLARENSTDAERSGMSSSVDDQDQKIYRDQQIAKSKGKKRKKGGKAGGGKGDMSPVSEDGNREL